jgi:hypothetical protein
VLTYQHNATSPIRSKPCKTIIRRTRFYRFLHVANDLNQIFFYRIRRVSIAVKIRSEQKPKAPSTTIPPYSSGVRYMRCARNVNRRGVPTPIGEPNYRSTRRWRGQSWTLIYSLWTIHSAALASRADFLPGWRPSTATSGPARSVLSRKRPRTPARMRAGTYSWVCVSR